MTEAVKPDIQERYITADGPSDVVTAAGWAAQSNQTVGLALLLWGVMYEGKTHQKLELAAKLGNHLNAKMARDRSLKGNAWKIAAEMLAWHLHGVCEPCEGRGYEVIKDTPSLSDNMCSHCGGQGKRPYPREASHVWMAAELSRMTAVAGGEVMKRLRVDMEL
jgi:hypothetical protein